MTTITIPFARLGGDIQTREHQGRTFGTFSVAVDQGYDTNKRTIWYECTVSAETLERMTKAGAKKGSTIRFKKYICKSAEGRMNMDMVLFVVHFENEDMLFFQGTRVPETSECQVFCDNNRAYIEEYFGYDYHDLGDVEEAGVITRERASEFWVVEHYETQDDWPKFMPVVEATISLCNTASVNIWAIEYGVDDRVLAGINNDTPEWCELLTNDEGISFFRLGELECLLSDAMRIAS